MFRCILSVLFLLMTTSVSAEDNALWTKANSISFKTTNSATIQTAAEQLLSLNEAVLDDALGQEQIILTIPMPNGEIITVELTPTLVMEEALATKYPNIKTYQAVQIGNPRNYGKVDKTANGFHGVINYQGKTVYIDPTDQGKSNLYKTYYASAQQSKERQFENRILKKKLNGFSSHNVAAKTTQSKLLTPINKEYRIAFATTGEYSEFHGGSTSKVLSAIVTLVNRLNQVLEVDLGVRLTLVADSEKAIFIDSAIDPFVNNEDDIFKNGEILNNLIGEANYDIGHVLTTGAGGLAIVGAACDNDSYEEYDNNDNLIVSSKPIKAMGITGSANPVNDSFYIDFVAHEIGHQLGADHTFNGQDGICFGSRTFYDAFEPGSGSTIMSYAGLCGEEDLQNQVDDYFHIHSMIEINDYLTNDTYGIGQSCGAVINTSNRAPIVDAGIDYNIPANTAFTLNASATDPDSDQLTYTWEQYDLGPGSFGKESMQDDGLKPIFRSFKPSTISNRTFPKLDSLLSGDLVTGENFATTDRQLNFKVTVRDGNGGVATDDVLLEVHNNDSQGFQVTYPTSEDYWGKQEYSMVQWNVANTHTAPISCDTVSIEFSDDNGKAFTEIAANLVNSGQAQITTPLKNTVQARLKINCENNVFFAVSKEAFEVFNSDQPNTKPTVLGLQSQSQYKSNQLEDTPFSLVIEDMVISDINSRFPDAFELFILPGENYSAIDGVITSDEHFNGPLSVNLQVNDGVLDSDIYALNVIIVAVNDAPIAYEDRFSINFESQTTLDVLANDVDIDNDKLQLIDVNYTGSAQIEVDNNTILYTPAAGFVGVDNFIYVIRDPTGAITRAEVTVEVVKQPSESSSGGVLVWLLCCIGFLFLPSRQLLNN